MGNIVRKVKGYRLRGGGEVRDDNVDLINADNTVIIFSTNSTLKEFVT